MAVLVERCCGLDIPKTSVVACLLVSPPHGETGRAIRTCGTMTEDLLAPAGWLAGAGGTHVAMEAPGVYRKPTWNLLGGDFDPLLANPRHIKAGTLRVPRPQDRRHRRRVDRGPAAPRAAAGQLRPRPAAAGTAGVAALPRLAGPGARGRGEPAPEDAGGGQHHR
jgi:hypothetical protein